MNLDIESVYNEMPNFQSHDEARQWFKNHLHDRIALRGSDIIDGKMIYFYHLIKSPQEYQQYMESFSRPDDHDITNAETFESYSTIEISEDGAVNFLP